MTSKEFKDLTDKNSMGVEKNAILRKANGDYGIKFIKDNPVCASFVEGGVVWNCICGKCF